MAFVAAGRLDGYWERNLQSWDMAAGQIIVREAGGIVSGIEGNDDALRSGNVICGNEFVHAELVKILDAHKRLGFGSFTALLQFGTLGHALTERNIRRFAADVLPALKAAGDAHYGGFDLARVAAQ